MSKPKRRGSALDHVASPRKKTMHRKSPSLEKVIRSDGHGKFPFPPSPGELAFGNRARFIEAVEARRVQEPPQTARGKEGTNLLNVLPPTSLGLRGLGVRGVVTAAFQACKMNCEVPSTKGQIVVEAMAAAAAAAPVEEKNVGSDSTSTLTGSSSSDEGESESDRGEDIERVCGAPAQVDSDDGSRNTSGISSTSGSENSDDGSDSDSSSSSSSDDGEDYDNEEDSSRSDNSKMHAITRNDSKSNRRQQKRRQSDRLAGTPKCLAALFDATNCFGSLSSNEESSEKSCGAAGLRAPSLGSRVKTIRHKVSSAGTNADAEAEFVLLPLPPADMRTDVSVSGAELKWTETLDSLLAEAVASAPPNRWDRVREILVSGSKARGKAAEEVSSAIGANAATDAAASSPEQSALAADPPNSGSSTMSPVTSLTNDMALRTSRIGSPHTQLSAPILASCDYPLADTPAKTPPTNTTSSNTTSSKTNMDRLTMFTAEDLQQRWRAICPPVKGPWCRDEDVQLRACVKLFGEERWSHIAKHIPGRRGKQCRERWKNHLDPHLNKSKWTKAEDMALLAAQRRIGNKWSEISKLLGCGRGENSVKNRFHSLRLGNKRSRSRGSRSNQGTTLESSSRLSSAP